MGQVSSNFKLFPGRSAALTRGRKSLFDLYWASQFGIALVWFDQGSIIERREGCMLVFFKDDKTFSTVEMGERLNNLRPPSFSPS